MEGDILEQHGTFEACGLAAYKGMGSTFCAENRLVAGTLFFCFIFFPRRDAYGMGVQKKREIGLRTPKSCLNCSFPGWHYPKHFKM